MHEKHWVALVDGENTQLRILNRIAKEKNNDVTIIVDIIHVIEYLWNAGRAFHPESGQELEKWVSHRLLEILRGKAGLMAGGMRRSATVRGLTAEERKPVDACATYLLNKSPYLKYNRYLSQGFPIATGVIEGACRHLIKDRMEITGAKWRLAGAEAILRLRALRSSHDFPLSDENDNSIVVKITMGNISILFPGDIMKKGEAELVRNHSAMLNSTVLIAPHHGSQTSSSDSFLDHVNPKTVIISAGYKNRFRLPHKKILKKYASRNYAVLRTDFNGAISMVTDGNVLTIAPFVINTK